MKSPRGQKTYSCLPAIPTDIHNYRKVSVFDAIEGKGE
jgi:hypothetical protein